MLELRPYQQKAVDTLYEWLSDNDGNPCIVMPTGSGKSLVIAAICRDVLTKWNDTRILMLTHVRELIEQNAQKLTNLWPNAPLGIVSSGLNRSDFGYPITFAGVQSVRSKALQLGHIDLIIVDECDLISHKDEGSYRQLITQLAKINPYIRVIGLTATPYRLGHGMITDKPAIFDGLIEPVSIKELIELGFLAVLRSKLTETELDVSGVKKRGGDYIESELQKAVDTTDSNTSVVNEVIEKAGNRQSWLFFCSGVEHAEHIRDLLLEKGVSAATVTGDTPKAERDRLISDFRAGKIKALTNANVLTVGTDMPNTDLLVMLRPTESARLYVQMAGRGMRPKSHTDHCLVMDFAGNVKKHGPIIHVQPPSKEGNGDGEAPTKACPNCMELVHLSVRQCTHCGYEFPEPESGAKKSLSLRQDDIMGIENRSIEIKSWAWRVHESQKSGKEMIKVTYYPKNYTEKAVSEYLCILHDGYAGQNGRRTLAALARQSGVNLGNTEDIDELCGLFFSASPPATIEVSKDGKWDRVIARIWAKKAENEPALASQDDFDDDIPF